ncbi:hypothetical protein JTE90_011064 [Oedothorax gibbosus]|uniref:Uncharacterized protein n=1 Tax=Oedothorax gibbosus TaxID=931172 RepID=A0AAV6VFM4_9ARAC|nr:hypothetical protein JTE90_011064 [Oedothorax gibbosus]
MWCLRPRSFNRFFSFYSSLLDWSHRVKGLRPCFEAKAAFLNIGLRPGIDPRQHAYMAASPAFLSPATTFFQQARHVLG